MLLSRHADSGELTYREINTLSKFIPTTRTSHGSLQPRNSTEDLPDGGRNYHHTISESFIHQEKKTRRQTHLAGDQITKEQRRSSTQYSYQETTEYAPSTSTSN